MFQCLHRLVLATVVVIGAASSARADIFQWEYINPADPSQGKQQSTTLVPDGAGVDAVPRANLSNRNLTMAYLMGANLDSATLSGANLTNAEVRGASFSPIIVDLAGLDWLYVGTGITLEQLYSTASYQAHDLSGIGLSGHNLTYANLSGQDLPYANFGYVSRGQDYTPQARLDWAIFTDANLHGANFYLATLTNADCRQANLTNARFSGAMLTGAAFTGSEVRGASFDRAIQYGYRFEDQGRSYFTYEYLVGTGITPPQLYATASYQAGNLSGIDFAYNNLAGGDFAGQNLTNANFYGATLTGADFAGADIRGALFAGVRLRSSNCRGCFYQVGTAITLDQLYATASYQARDLSRINLSANDLASANFSRQNLKDTVFQNVELTDASFREANLINANFYYATLTGADFSQSNLTNVTFVGATLTGANFTAADARGGYLYDFGPAIITNLIRPDGHIDGLNLGPGELLVVRDYDGDTRYEPALPPIPITVDQHLVMGLGSALRMMFEADAWDSTISFTPGILVTLGGALEFTFADEVNLASQVGRTFDLFDWSGVTPVGAFAIASPYRWDLSNLYTTGEVTLAAVPEPSVLLLFSVALAVLVPMGRVRLSSNSRKGEYE
jgi:uncharacterized protein YjbI with pentapeptide repeats